MWSPLTRFLAHLTPKRSVANQGERIAAKSLRRQGYCILGRNLRNRFGEVDILARAPDGRTIIFMEVKAAAHRIETMPPEVHVTAKKQQKLIALAAQIA